MIRQIDYFLNSEIDKYLIPNKSRYFALTLESKLRYA